LPEEKAPGLVAAEPYASEVVGSNTHGRKISQLWRTQAVPMGTAGWRNDPGELIMENMADRARLIGFNHVALEVGDIEEALEFYGRLFDIELRGRGPKMAFIDAGDQFIALAEGENPSPDDHRHIGMVVDDRRAVRRALREMGVEILPGRGLDFLDPWGNHWQVVDYSEIQFTKAPEILRGMGLEDLKKSKKALEELRKKGLAP
jgi:lactoylglutathione lyase